MRQSLGTTVFAGMLGLTAFGQLFTPAFLYRGSQVRSQTEAACRNGARSLTPKQTDRMLGFSDARFGNGPLDGDPAASSRRACRTRRGVVGVADPDRGAGYAQKYTSTARRLRKIRRLVKELSVKVE
jgi:hypothetical protein